MYACFAFIALLLSKKLSLSIYLYLAVYYKYCFSLFISIAIYLRLRSARVVLHTNSINSASLHATEVIHGKDKGNRPFLAKEDRKGYTKGSSGVKAREWAP